MCYNSYINYKFLEDTVIKSFLNTTDNFLCMSIRNSFSVAEKQYERSNLQIDILRELKNFQENPLGCMIGVKSKFEVAIKVKIKFILAIFFVIIPLIGFSFVTYITDISETYAFLMTFVIAILVASRMEAISKRYVQTRMLEFQTTNI